MGRGQTGPSSWWGGVWTCSCSCRSTSEGLPSSLRGHGKGIPWVVEPHCWTKPSRGQAAAPPLLLCGAGPGQRLAEVLARACRGQSAPRRSPTAGAAGEEGAEGRPSPGAGRQRGPRFGRGSEVTGQRGRRPGHVCSRRRARGSGATCRARAGGSGRAGRGAGDGPERAPAPPAAPAAEPSAGQRGGRARSTSCVSRAGRAPAGRAGGRCCSADTGGQRLGVGGENGGAAPLKEAWRAPEYAGGSVAEWSKALDLGSSHFDGVGSNPTAAKLVLSPWRRLLFANGLARPRWRRAGAARRRYGLHGAGWAGHGARGRAGWVGE